MITINYFDVLVVGGGQGALMAAISARELGASVALLTKGKVGMGGASVISDGVYSAILDPDDSPENFYQDILIGGRSLSDKKRAYILAEDCTHSVLELRDKYGLKLYFEKTMATPGHCFPRRVYIEDSIGSRVPKTLRKRAQSLGIAFLEKLTFIDLIKQGDEVGGVRALSNENGDILSFFASSTVLAFGGLGGLYANTDNPSDLTGEGLGVVWRHGGAFTDMEFVQFYPYRLVEPKSLDLYTKIFGLGARMLNEKGHRFMDSFPRKELETRDRVCYEMDKQEKVLLDIVHVVEEDLKEASPQLAKFLSRGYYGELKMAPVQHFCMGGILVDEKGETGIPGLLACGECTGGLHGANRLGGGALTETLVFGKITGKRAAIRALARGLRKSLCSIEAKPKFNLEVVAKEVKAVKGKIKEIMARKVGIRRSTITLEEAKLELERLMEEIKNLELRPMETQYLLDLVRAPWLVVMGACQRKESRGSHWVQEFPSEDRKWERNIYLKDKVHK